MKLCILENDILEGQLAESYGGFGNMFFRLFESVSVGVGVEWDIAVFNTMRGEYPASFDTYDAVLLTGSRADSFSDDAWVVELRRQVTVLLGQGKKMVGVCFGHQLIALCLGAPVGRAPQGWGTGRMTYDWHRPDLPHSEDRTQISLLASHQDQVLALPAGATLVASNAFCPVASFTVGNAVFCIQPHPEFSEDVSAYLLEKRRHVLGEEKYLTSVQSLEHGHEGAHIGRMVVAFLQGQQPLR